MHATIVACQYYDIHFVLVYITFRGVRMFIFSRQWRWYVSNIPWDVRGKLRVVGFQQDLSLPVYITFHLHCTQFVYRYHQWHLRKIKGTLFHVYFSKGYLLLHLWGNRMHFSKNIMSTAWGTLHVFLYIRLENFKKHRHT
jgi:hypothetical protein